MPVVQITYDVPLSIAKGLTTGELRTLGTAAIRDSTGITAHIREVSRTVSQGDQVLGANIAKSLKDPRMVAVGLGVVAVVAAAGGGVGWITGKRKTAVESAASELAADFNSALSSYLTAVNQGTVDNRQIEVLMTALDSMTEVAQEGAVAVEMSNKEWGALVAAIADYTRQLADANSVELHAAEVATPEPEDSSIIDLRRYLDVQRQIFKGAA